MAFPNTLLGKVATRKNLQAAWDDISRSSRPQSHGLSDQTIKDFGANSRSNLEKIRSELVSGNYQFGKVRGVSIEKKGGKKRPLKITDIRDRVVQRAIVRVLSKPLSEYFYLDNSASFAYMKKKGVRSAIKQMLEYHQRGCKYILEADIINFFGTVDLQELLNEMIFPRLADQSLNRLIEDAFRMEIGNWEDIPQEDWDLYPESSSGLPQGGYLSPLFSNVYLAEFDRMMVEANFRVIRYADDFIVMCETREEAEAAYTLSIQILEKELNLKVHDRKDDDKTAKTRIVRISQNPIHFLGIQFNGSRIWPSSDKQLKFTNKLDSISRNPVNVLGLLNSMKNMLEGWVAAYGFTDLNPDYIQKIDDQVNIHLLKALNKLGLKLDSRILDEDQRFRLGVHSIKTYLKNVRGNFKQEDQELFRKYWSN